MARATGLEPAASGVTGRRSNQLSYARSLNAQVQRAVTIGRLRERESPVKHALRGVEGGGIAHRSALADERSGHEFQGHERRSRVRRGRASASGALKRRGAGSSRDTRERSLRFDRGCAQRPSSPARTSCDPMPWRWAAGRTAIGASAPAATSRPIHGHLELTEHDVSGDVPASQATRELVTNPLSVSFFTRSASNSPPNAPRLSASTPLHWRGHSWTMAIMRNTSGRATAMTTSRSSR
jgi:hypothetical protein